MKQIRIYKIGCNDLQNALNSIHIGNFCKDYQFVYDKDSPDYLIATEHIYKDSKCKKEFQDLYRQAKINIYFGGESITPDFNLFDYVVGFDGNLRNGDRFVQHLPPMLLFHRFINKTENDVTTMDAAEGVLKEKRGFCNFLYSNSKAHPNRDKLFFELSKYKKVDSLGFHLNNVGNHPTGFYGHWDECVQLKKPYKFSIASENAAFAGYTSEKVLTSLAAHTVPIYFGDPLIEDYINPECIINFNRIKIFDELIKVVRRIDESDELWCRMISAPWQTEEQLRVAKEREDCYYHFWHIIFDQDTSDAQRAPQGTYPDLYRRFFFQAPSYDYYFIPKRSLIERGIGKLKRMMK